MENHIKCKFGNIMEYDENTDLNGILGRPNQYIQKINFADTRLEQYDESNPIGGTVEVFNNSQDAKARYDYVTSVGQAIPMAGLQGVYFYGQAHQHRRLAGKTKPLANQGAKR